MVGYLPEERGLYPSMTAREAIAFMGALRGLPAGAATGRPLVMGVLNVTPDSFSDGGQFDDAAQAVAHGRRLVAVG